MTQICTPTASKAAHPGRCPRCGGLDRAWLTRNRKRAGFAGLMRACCCSQTQTFTCARCDGPQPNATITGNTVLAGVGCPPMEPSGSYPISPIGPCNFLWFGLSDNGIPTQISVIPFLIGDVLIGWSATIRHIKAPFIGGEIQGIWQDQNLPPGTFVCSGSVLTGSVLLPVTAVADFFCTVVSNSVMLELG